MTEVSDILSRNTIRLNCVQVKQINSNRKSVSKMKQLQIENFPKIHMYYTSSKFDEIFLQAIDNTFSTLLGENAKQAFFSFLDKKYMLNEKEVPDKIGDFVDGLEQIFGASASLLELEAMKNLKKKVPLFCYLPKNSDLSFKAYAESLKEVMANL